MSESALLALLSRPLGAGALTVDGDPSLLFPVLKRLERDGLVVRRRGLYRLTSRGKRELAVLRALALAVARAV